MEQRIKLNEEKTCIKCKNSYNGVGFLENWFSPSLYCSKKNFYGNSFLYANLVPRDYINMGFSCECFK